MTIIEVAAARRKLAAVAGMMSAYVIPSAA
jgi:hypothetical protein